MGNKHPVVIIGGGPVGLTMSIALSVRGIFNVVLERQSRVYELPRAIVMDAEIRRAFVELGFGSELANVLTPMSRADFVDSDGNEVMGIDVSHIHQFGLPAVSCHYQPELDELLLSIAKRCGADIRFGCEVIGIDATEQQVSVTTVDGENVCADFVVACDGASSSIRKKIGIQLEDLAFEQDWLVVDLEILHPEASQLPNVTRQVCDRDRPVTLVRGHKNFYRFEFQLQPGEIPSEMNTERTIWSLLEKWVTPKDVRLIRHAAYRFHGVVATSMQQGRIFLAGDSAHQMPPFMGQGLNTGMRDAFNLSWKMALVVKGRAKRKILETYGQERIDHAKSVVMHSIDTGRLIDQIAGRVSHGIEESAGYGGARPQPKLGESRLQFGQQDNGTMFTRIHELEGAEMKDGSFQLVSSTKSMDHFSLFGTPLQSHALDGIEGMYLVRPDGYVAGVFESNRELAKYLDQIASEFA